MYIINHKYAQSCVFKYSEIDKHFLIILCLRVIKYTYIGRIKVLTDLMILLGVHMP